MCVCTQVHVQVHVCVSTRVNVCVVSMHSGVCVWEGACGRLE